MRAPVRVSSLTIGRAFRLFMNHSQLQIPPAAENNPPKTNMIPIGFILYGLSFYPLFVCCFYLFGLYLGVPEDYGVTEIQLAALLEVEGFLVES